ncbi:MAG: hypothetical protein J6K20_01640 [Thermoguttaceae bacterium]|nr:hypothetical protein [Thermoguttaceae bacterium]
MAKERETRGGGPGKASPPPVARPSGSVPQVPQRNDGGNVPVPAETGPKSAARLSLRLSVCGTKSKR